MPMREAEAVLALWREAERRLPAFPPGSPEADALQAEIVLLREEYQRLDEIAHGQPKGSEPARSS